MAGTETTMDISWIQNIFDGLGIPLILPIKIFKNNLNANYLANNVAVNNRARHIVLRECYVMKKV